MSDRLFPTERDQAWVDPRPRPELGLLQLVLEAYPDPCPTATVEQFAKFTHDDVRTLDEETLQAERLLAYLRRALERPPSPWLCQRIVRLDAESQRRKGKGRRS